MDELILCCGPTLTEAIRGTPRIVPYASWLALALCIVRADSSRRREQRFTSSVWRRADARRRPVGRRHFGRNVKRLRLRADLSPEELGFRANLHRTEIGMLERGIRLPKLDTIIKVAGALEIEAGELFEGLDWTPGRSIVGTEDIERMEQEERSQSDPNA